MRFVLRGSRERNPHWLCPHRVPAIRRSPSAPPFVLRGGEGETRAARRKKAEQVSPKELRRARRSVAGDAPAKRLDPRGVATRSTVPESGPYDTGKNLCHPERLLSA